MNILLAISLALALSTPTLEVYEVEGGWYMPKCTIVKNKGINNACVYIYHTQDGPLVVTYNAERK